MESGSSPHDLLVGFLLVQNAVQKRSENFFGTYGLNSAQFNILNLLGLSGGSLGQQALAERLLVGKSSISIVIGRMVKADLIQREQNPKDRREVILKWTPKGAALWHKITPLYEAGVREVFGSLSAQRGEYFLFDLETLYAKLKHDADSASSINLRETIRRLSFGG